MGPCLMGPRRPRMPGTAHRLQPAHITAPNHQAQRRTQNRNLRGKAASVSHGEPNRRVHALVTGRVQGVGFRATTHQAALQLALAGWVRNLQDGRVEVVAEGEQESLEAFVAFLHRGPRLARVVNVSVQWGAARGESQPFAVKSTM